jgi:hypothetical protein
MSTKHQRKTKPPREPPDRESGRPGGGQGRIDEVGRTGVYPGSGALRPSRRTRTSAVNRLATPTNAEQVRGPGAHCALELVNPSGRGDTAFAVP